MDRHNKDISVDDILNEYTQMAGNQRPPQKPHTIIEPSGDQVWRPESHGSEQESPRYVDPQPVMQSSGKRNAQSAAGQRGAKGTAAKKKRSLLCHLVEKIRSLANQVTRKKRRKPE